MSKVYSYIRFSTPEQARGDSLRRQLADAEEWCAGRGLVLDQSLRDLGISAYKGSNAEVGSGLGSFLELVKTGKVERGSILIVESLDRLSRENVLVALPRFLDLLNAGIRIVTLTDKQEYSAEEIRENWNPLIVSLAVMARAHDESRVKGIRVARAWANKRELARNGSHKLTRRAPAWLELVGDEFVPDEDRANIVKRIFRETIEGYGRRTIANRLNEEGVPAFRGKNGWHASSIAKILSSRAVFGEFQPGIGSNSARNHRPEGDPIKNYFPVIVDETTYWRAQGVIAGRRINPAGGETTVVRGKGGRRGHGVSHLLIGLGKCHSCRGPMHIINKGQPPKGALYLQCSTASRRAGCDNGKRWRVDVIERRLLKHLSYIDVDAVLHGKTFRKEAEAVESLRSKLTATEAKRDAVLRVVATGDEAAVKLFNVLVAEIHEIKAELARAEKTLSQISADPGLKTRLADAVDLSRAMDDATAEERTAIRTRLAEQLRQIVDVIWFLPDIGVEADLKIRPDLQESDIPFVWGDSTKRLWRLDLNWDHDGNGTAPWEFNEMFDEVSNEMLDRHRGGRRWPGHKVSSDD
ncbi:recombinase family protein [Roseibium polysiphoniae]|uniref:recombinase family protein n=1 Tax=Roseibium polysiphoniae TaxID=2571221 RepID=UPI001784203A